MTTADEIKKAEQRGYAKGYASGRKRRKADLHADHVHKEKQAFLDKAFLAALPACMEIQGWSINDVPVKSKEDRVKLAWRFAQEALKQRRCA